MKKLLLLLFFAPLALNVTAQERQMSVVSTTGELQMPTKYNRSCGSEIMNAMPQSGQTANKTTSGGSRWYNYFPYMDTVARLAGQMGWNAAQLMWQDTMQSGQFTSGLSHINLSSMGMIFDPSCIAFNDSNYYPGLMKVGNTDAYTIDSVSIIGYYDFNPAKTAVKDTIRLSFVKGMGSSSAGDDIFNGWHLTSGHYSGDYYLEMHFDSVLNYARSGTTYGTPTASTGIQDIVLDNSTTPPAWADTLTTGSVGAMVRAVHLANPLSVPAGGFAGMSISFKSGDPALLSPPASTLPGDTLFYSTGANKYNFFRPFVSYFADQTSTHTQQWAPYNVADSNVGQFARKFSPSHVFSPTWAWSTSNGTAPSSLQYPFISWHVTCTTCGVITNIPPNRVNTVYAIDKINAYPNPVSNELNIAFNLNQKAPVTVSLSNMLGQVVATQDMGNVISGNAMINTASLPGGVYIYSVVANGQRSTGRVIIAH